MPRVEFFVKLSCQLNCQLCHTDLVSNCLYQSVMVWYYTLPKFQGTVLIMDTITMISPYHIENIIQYIIYKLYNTFIIFQ